MKQFNYYEETKKWVPMVEEEWASDELDDVTINDFIGMLADLEPDLPKDEFRFLENKINKLGGQMFSLYKDLQNKKKKLGLKT